MAVVLRTNVSAPVRALIKPSHHTSSLRGPYAGKIFNPGLFRPTLRRWRDSPLTAWVMWGGIVASIVNVRMMYLFLICQVAEAKQAASGGDTRPRHVAQGSLLLESTPTAMGSAWHAHTSMNGYALPAQATN